MEKDKRKNEDFLENLRKSENVSPEEELMYEPKGKIKGEDTYDFIDVIPENSMDIEKKILYKDRLNSHLSKLNDLLKNREDTKDVKYVKLRISDPYTINSHLDSIRLESLCRYTENALFLEDSSKPSLTDPMRELIARYFPNDFDSEKIRNPDEYDDSQISLIHSRLIEKAQAYVIFEREKDI